MKKILAFDIGGTYTKFGILNDLGDILSKGKIKTEVETEEVFISNLVEIIEEKKKENIEGVAISMPGFIDSNTGLITACYAIQCMVNKSIIDILEKKTGLKVSVENDGKCAALAEKFSGNAKECNDFICMTVGTGIGGGIFINGKILKGHSFRGGEFGFMSCEGLDINNQHRGMLSVTGSTRGIIETYKEYKNITREVEGEEIFEIVKTDKDVQAIIENWYFSIALGIMNLSATLNPEKILLGGGVSERVDFVENIQKALDKIKWWADVSCSIEVCKHKNDAGLIGAVYNFLH